jgi:hypothetical protein
MTMNFQEFINEAKQTKSDIIIEGVKKIHNLLKQSETGIGDTSSDEGISNALEKIMNNDWNTKRDIPNIEEDDGDNILEKILIKIFGLKERFIVLSIINTLKSMSKKFKKIDIKYNDIKEEFYDKLHI